MSQNSTSTQQQPPSSSPTSVVVTPATAPARPTTVVPNAVSPVAANSTPIPSTTARPTSVSDPRATDIPIPLEPSSSSGGSSFFSDNAGLITGIGAAFLVLVMIIAAILRTRKKRARTDKLIQKTLEEAEKARLQELNRRGDRPPPSPSMAPSMGARYAPPPQLSRGGSQMQSPYRPPVAPFSPALAPSPQLTYSQGPYYQNGSPAQPNFGGPTGIPPMSQGYRSSMERFGAPPPQPAAYGYGAPPQPRNDAYATDYVAGPEAPYENQYEDGYENVIEPYNEQGGDYVVAAEEPGGAQPAASTKVYLDPPTKMYAQ